MLKTCLGESHTVLYYNILCNNFFFFFLLKKVVLYYFQQPVLHHTTQHTFCFVNQLVMQIIFPKNKVIQGKPCAMFLAQEENLHPKVDFPFWKKSHILYHGTRIKVWYKPWMVFNKKKTLHTNLWARELEWFLTPNSRAYIRKYHCANCPPCR